MSNTRNDILNAFKNVADGMAANDFGQFSAIVGLLHPKQITATPKLEVWYHTDYGSHIENNSRRKVRVTTVMKFKHDASDTTDRGPTQIEQANAAYDLYHAAVETAYKTMSAATTPFSGFTDVFTIVQEEPGIQCDGIDDGDDYVRIGEVWIVEYERAEGAT